jgi:hypothetical protein
MDIEDYKKIILEYETRSNKDLVNVMERINEEFEKTKQQVINMTYYLDNLEITYNKILKEYQKRQNGPNW